jgi:5-methylcytosine-specific restriction protein A
MLLATSDTTAGAADRLRRKYSSTLHLLQFRAKLILKQLHGDTMSKQRWSKAKQPQRDADGQFLCLHCDQPIRWHGKKWCSDECRHEYLIRTNPSYVRQALFARDRGICAGCGLDCEKALAEMNARMKACGTLTREAMAIADEYSFSWSRLRRHDEPDGTHYPQALNLWEVDHIVAVTEGGGECSLSNLRTLCPRCHKQATADLHKRLTEARREEEQQAREREESRKVWAFGLGRSYWISKNFATREEILEAINQRLDRLEASRDNPEVTTREVTITLHRVLPEEIEGSAAGD